MGKNRLRHVYAVALGSNRARSRALGPQALVRAALDMLDQPPLRLKASSHIISSTPLGPSRRRYANAAAIVASDLAPPQFLARLQAVEAHFGRRRGQRWAARTLDLDIILWSGGIWADDALQIPHIAFRGRDFVLAPMAEVAPKWRDPVTNIKVRALFMRLYKPKPVDRSPAPD